MDNPRMIVRDVFGPLLIVSALGGVSIVVGIVWILMGRKYNEFFVGAGIAIFIGILIWRGIASGWMMPRAVSASDPGAPALASRTSRFVVAGKPAILADRIARLSRDPFEPVIFRAIGAIPASRYLVSGTLTFVLLGASAATRYMLGTQLSGGMLEIFGAFALSAIVVAFWEPTFFRIIPGRLDLLVYPITRRNRPIIERFDLRRESLVLDCDNHVLYFRTDGKIRAIQYGSVSNIPSFEAGVINASVSEHLVPELPDDDLVG